MIKFGTDGWRAIIGDEFTFENVRIVTQAICDYVLEENKKNPTIAVGYDARFMSLQFAEQVAEVVAANGIRCLLSQELVPTPTVSYFVKNNCLDGGIVVTASHNPAEYNGIKFKAPYGGSATPEIMERITLKLGQQAPKLIVRDKSLLEKTDMLTPYIEHLRNLIDFNKIGQGDFKIVYDPMFGAGQEVFERLLVGSKVKLGQIRAEINPSFPGINPEPISQHLQALKQAVQQSSADIGIATDGDADRIGAVDSKGNFVNSHQIFSLLISHLVENKGWEGMVVKTFSTTKMIDKLCSEYGLALQETPIGFKYICDCFLEEDVLIGGEESGGIAIRHHVPERDGILMGLLLLEMMATHKQSIDELIASHLSSRGMYMYDRVDLKLKPEQKEKLVNYVKQATPDEIEGYKVKNKETIDGYKFIFEDNSWLLFRPSGTEPVIRIYSEAPTQEIVERLLSYGCRLAEEM